MNGHATTVDGAAARERGLRLRRIDAARMAAASAEIAQLAAICPAAAEVEEWVFWQTGTTLLPRGICDSGRNEWEASRVAMPDFPQEDA